MSQSVFALALVIVVGLFIWFFYGPWQSYCVDRGRQSLFEVRDKLFDLCLSGEWDFQSPEYKILRAQIEKLIRYAHRISIPGVIFLVVRSAALDKPQQVTAIFDAAKKIENPKLRAKVEKITTDIPVAILTWLIGPRSLVLIILYVFAHLFSAAKKRLRSIEKIAVLSVEIEADRQEAVSWERAQSAETTEHYPRAA